MKQVRMAQLSDASGIAHVHWASWMETYAGLIDPGYLAQRSEEKSRQAFESAGCRDMAVALLDNEIVGFAGFGQAGS
ncbi:MAG TPA: GNAT family N-acetyltransferase, partial [Candidatus Ventrousia excrementavium]|nr:GNAT family N-acetyltransferase [Candidatus Ventrousia excrementavium]